MINKEEIPNTDREIKFYLNGLGKGANHTYSSPNTLKVFKSMNEELKDVKNTQIEHGLDMKGLKTDMLYIKEAMKKVTNFCDTADEKFASKKYVDKVFGTAILGLIGFLGWTIRSFVIYITTQLK